MRNKLLASLLLPFGVFGSAADLAAQQEDLPGLEREQFQQEFERERVQQEQRRQRDLEDEQRQQNLAREQRQQNLEQEQEQSQQNLERAQRQQQLERAQSQLEEAARDIARLSAQFTADAMGNVAQRFRYAGQRAMLGLNVEDTDRGVRVVGVSPNGPASAAGMQADDVILSIDGAELAAGGNQSPSELLFAQMANVEPGESVNLSIARGDREMDLTVVARELDPRDFFSQWSDFDFSFPRGPAAGRRIFGLERFGAFNAWRSMELVSLTPELGAYFGTEQGLLVVRAPESNDLGLRDGDVILDIGGREPTTPEHAMRILASFAPGETLRVTIMRNRQRETLELALPADSASERGADTENGGV